MGCVQSHQQERGGRRHSGDRRSPQKQQQHQQQQQYRQQQHRQQNGQQRQQVQQKTTSDSRRLSDHLYENVSPQRETSPVKNDDGAYDSQFRRQHFDRNSCLRHSKKRKKSSSVSNPNSPATLTGSDSAILQRSGQTNSNQNSPTNNNRSVDENGKVDVFSYETQEVDVDDVFIEKIEDRNPHQSTTASSRVAALLSAEPVNPMSFNPTKQVSANSKTTLSNGSRSVTTTSSTTTKSSPTKMSKVSNPTNGQNHSVGRTVLRTRRQAAQEEEEQRNRGRRKAEGQDIEKTEDCGRLI